MQIKIHFRQLLLILLGMQQFLSAQVDTAYSFIVAGHAYGAHAGTNTGLHPSLLNSLNAGFDPKTSLFVFTGDIVNVSTTESWQQVDTEMEAYGLPYYFAMGNHDANSIGEAVFNEKFGGLYYAFYSQHDLFIVLNSIEADRAISVHQINFLKEQIDLASAETKNVFIFFHEVIWNSNEKYIAVRSNSRSRYEQIVSYSNYWEEVHPVLLSHNTKNFYLITGDVGGNPDAIAAFYDKWDNVTLISSGMGEVADENYLLVKVSANTSVDFELVPLDPGLTLPDIEFYSVPPAPGNIAGPQSITPGSTAISYSVAEVFNAESYTWILPEGATGNSSSETILVDFGFDFQGGEISVKCYRDGFGTGPESSLMIQAEGTSNKSNERHSDDSNISVCQINEVILISTNNFNHSEARIRLYDLSGKTIWSQTLEDLSGSFNLQIDASKLLPGIVFISVYSDKGILTEKFMIY